MLIPNNFFEYILHIGCAVSLHSITNSGWIAGGQNSRERQTVYFTAVNPMNQDHRDPQELDLTKPRLASYKQKWKRHQDTVYWVNIQLAHCIPKVIMMESGEIKNVKVYASPRPPPKISCKDNWMNDLDSEVAGSSKDNPTNPTKTKKLIVKNWETCKWTRIHQGDRERYLVWWTSSTQQDRGDPYVDQNPQKMLADTYKN